MNENYKAWTDILKDEFNKEYFLKITSFLNHEYSKKEIFPPKELVFNIFKKVNPNDIKVVILGQDPYHGINQANGMSFSVNKGEKIPPSLRNIYLELYSDLKIDLPKHGDLTSWVNQGVFLLNATLTVEKGKPNSHKDIGWQIFTDKVISTISKFDFPKVFILWGNFAISKKFLIENNKNNFIISSPHPSPFSANKGFFGSHPFSKTNNFLINNGIKPIDWRIKP